MNDLIREAIDIAEQAITAAKVLEEQLTDFDARVERLRLALELQLTSVPDRVTRAVVECALTVGDVDDWTVQIPCTFAGDTDVVVFDDTQEIFWVCPVCGGTNEGRA